MCKYDLHGTKKADQKISLTIQVPCFYLYTERLHVTSAAALILYLGDIEKVGMRGTGE